VAVLRVDAQREWRVILVCGEALFDVYAAGETATGLMLDARCGGSPFNVAVGLARLNQPVALLTQLSRGFLGDRLLRQLRAEGVDDSALQYSDAPTTLSLVGLDARGVPSYAFYGADAADRLLALDALERLPAGLKAINVGSYATVTGVTAVTQRALIDREHARTLIAYDPNVRLNVEPDLARWREQLAWMLPRTHLLKISAEDLQLLDAGTTPEEFALRALGQGVSVVVVTLGEHGALAMTQQGCIDEPAVPTAVIDTVGAGDTFQAALLAWLAEHDGLSRQALAALPSSAWRSALKFAAGAAAITCSRRGADLPRRAEIR
jgi:fructokinase